MPNDDLERRLGEAVPPPRDRFERLRERIVQFGIGPIPVGSIFLLAVLYVLPVVLVWRLLDQLPHWLLKAALIGVTVVFWAYYRDRQLETSDK